MKNIISNTLTTLYSELNKEYQDGSFGYGAIAIIGQSCLGSIAVMLIFMNDALDRTAQSIELFLVVVLCMGFNGSVLSQQKAKVQVNILIVSVMVSLIIIILNLI